MKVRLKIINSLGTFYSAILDDDGTMLAKLEETCEQFSSLSSFTLCESKKITHYFGSEILKRSIATLEVIEEKN